MNQSKAAPANRPGRLAWARILKKGVRGALLGAGSLALIFGAFVGLAYLFPDPFVRWIGEWWDQTETPRPADAIVVLGGGDRFRPQQAAKLFHEGVTPKILVTRPPEPPSHPRRAQLYTKSILIDAGVPPEAIIFTDDIVHSTWDEATSVATWARENDASTILICTDRFHARRVGWVYQRQVEAVTDCDCVVVRAPFYHFDRRDWWADEHGVLAFQNEVIKLVYYLLNY